MDELNEFNPDYDPEEIERERRRQWESKIAPYRAMAQQQNEQDELIAELLFKETMRELEDL